MHKYTMVPRLHLMHMFMRRWVRDPKTSLRDSMSGTLVGVFEETSVDDDGHEVMGAYRTETGMSRKVEDEF
jgi:hypothetical protein